MTDLLRRVNRILVSHPWWYGGVAAVIMFALFMLQWPVLAAGPAAIGVFFLVGWSWSNGPSRRSYDQREEQRAKRSE